MREWCLRFPRAVALAFLAFIVLAMALLARDVPPVHANPTQYSYFKAAYPSSPLSLFPNAGPHNGCLVCHPTTAGPRTTFPPQFFNAYGTAYAAGPHATQTAAVAALRSIESANSDDDGPIITVLKGGGTFASGTVWSSAGSFSCRPTEAASPSCTMTFSNGDSIALDATGDGCGSPFGGSAFAGWSGGGTPACSGTGSCIVRADNLTEIDRGTLPGEPSSRPTITVTASFDFVSCPNVLPPPPTTSVDLVVTGLTAPTVGTIGATIEVSLAVRNQGTSVAPSNRLSFFFSDDPTIRTTDVPSTTTCGIPALAPGQTASCTSSVIVPVSLTPGAYRFGAIVDDQNVVPETNEVNNARAADTGPITLVGPGTSPSRVSLNKTFYAPGDVLSLTLLTQSSASVADFYLVLFVPGGFAYIFDGTNFALIYNGTQIFPGALHPFLANAAVTNISEIVLEAIVPPSIPRGAYSFSLFLVRAGADPLNTSNWLTSPSQAAFNF